MQFEVWIPEITLHRDGPHLLNWSVIKRHGQRSYEWACVCQLTKGLWLNWPHHHSVKAWGIQGTLWHLRSPSYLKTIWRVGGNQLLLRGCSDKTDQSLMVFPSDQSWGCYYFQKLPGVKSLSQLNFTSAKKFHKGLLYLRRLSVISLLPSASHFLMLW